MAVMDVVVPCDCGTQFSFAVEPVNERLPENAELLCPGCGKDGVPLANRVIRDTNRKREREQLAQQRLIEEAQQPKKASWFKPEKKNHAATVAPVPSFPATHDPFAQVREKDDSVYTGP